TRFARSSTTSPAATTTTATAASTTTTATSSARRTTTTTAASTGPVEALPAGVASVAEALCVAAATSRSLEGAALTTTAATLSNSPGPWRCLPSTIPEASGAAAISDAAARLLPDPTLLTEPTLAIARACLANPTLLPSAAKLGSLPGAAAERLSGLSVGGPSLVEALLRGVVPILHTLAVLGIVLPVASVPASSGPARGLLRRSLRLAVACGLHVVHVLSEVVRA